MRVFDTDSVNTEFRWYHYPTIWKYKRITLRKFHKEAKLAIEEGEPYVSEQSVSSFWERNSLEGMKMKAAEAGIQMAIHEIDVVYEKETHYGMRDAYPGWNVVKKVSKEGETNGTKG